MCQAGGSQPYLKRDFNAKFLPANVEEFSKWIIVDKKRRQILEIKVFRWNVLDVNILRFSSANAKILFLIPSNFKTSLKIS